MVSVLVQHRPLIKASLWGLAGLGDEQAPATSGVAKPLLAILAGWRTVLWTLMKHDETNWNQWLEARFKPLAMCHGTFRSRSTGIFGSLQVNNLTLTWPHVSSCITLYIGGWCFVDSRLWNSGCGSFQVHKSFQYDSICTFSRSIFSCKRLGKPAAEGNMFAAACSARGLPWIWNLQVFAR